MKLIKILGLVAVGAVGSVYADNHLTFKNESNEKITAALWCAGGGVKRAIIEPGSTQKISCGALVMQTPAINSHYSKEHTYFGTVNCTLTVTGFDAQHNPLVGLSCPDTGTSIQVLGSNFHIGGSGYSQDATAWNSTGNF